MMFFFGRTNDGDMGTNDGSTNDNDNDGFLMGTLW